MSPEQIRELAAQSNALAPSRVPVVMDWSDGVGHQVDTNVESFGAHPRALRGRLPPLARLVGWTDEQIDGAAEAWSDMGNPSDRIVTIDGCGIILEAEGSETNEETGVRHDRVRWHIGLDAGTVYVDGERSVHGVGVTGGGQ